MVHHQECQELRTRLWCKTLQCLPSVSDYFQTGGTELSVTTLTGASWYVLNTATNALPTEGRWLIAQITTTGSISGTLNYQIFPLGVGENQVQKSVDFDGAGEFPQSVTVTVCGCMDQTACNYNLRPTTKTVHAFTARLMNAGCVVEMVTSVVQTSRLAIMTRELVATTARATSIPAWAAPILARATSAPRRPRTTAVVTSVAC